MIPSSAGLRYRVIVPIWTQVGVSTPTLNICGGFSPGPQSGSNPRYAVKPQYGKLGGRYWGLKNLSGDDSNSGWATDLVFAERQPRLPLRYL